MKKSQLKNLIRQVIKEAATCLGWSSGTGINTSYNCGCCRHGGNITQAAITALQQTDHTVRMFECPCGGQLPNSPQMFNSPTSKKINEGPDDCYHEYRIWTPNGNIQGNYFGKPIGGSNIFSCADSNWLHSWLGFDSNPYKIASIKQNIPPNSGTHGFRANCIEFGGTSNTPSSMGTMHITNINALGGPAYNPYVEDYQTIEECIKSYKKPIPPEPHHEL